MPQPHSPTPGIRADVGFCFFGTCTLEHLDHAWWTLSRQNMARIRHIYVLNNNTQYHPDAVHEVLDRYPIPRPVLVQHVRHDGSKTHCWSVNHVCRDWMVDADWIFWTRSDYLLDYEALEAWCQGAEAAQANDPACRPFVTSWVHLIGYRFALGTPIDGVPYDGTGTTEVVDLSTLPWREHGPRFLLGRVPGASFEKTARDAGVWLTQRKNLAEAGWMNEKMVGWGFQQSIFQSLMKECGVDFIVASTYFVHHQEHPVVRSLEQAKTEAEAAHPEIYVVGPAWGTRNTQSGSPR